MHRTPDAAAIEHSLVNSKPAYLRYYHALLRQGLPGEAAGEAHAQRLLILYLCVVGCDLLRDNWLPAHSPCTAADGGRSPLALSIEQELRRCHDARTGAFCAQHTTTTTASAIPEPLSATVPMTHCALHTLMVCGTLADACQSWLDPRRTAEFVLQCQQRGTHGGFCSTASEDGECDVRITYSAFVAFTVLLPMLPTNSEAAEAFTERVKESIRCGCHFVMGCWRPTQGGFAAMPESSPEAHGGMTFCAIASLRIAECLVGLPVPCPLAAAVRRYAAARVARGPSDELLLADPDHWAIGFQGRPGKPCDTCYTHWTGATLAMVRRRGTGEVAPLPIAQFCVLSLDTDEDEDGTPGLGVIARAPEVEADIVHATLGLSGALLTLRGADLPFKALWGVASSPHPIYGCSEATAISHGLPSVS